MRKISPLLAVFTALLVACSAGGDDVMAELLRDAGELIDDALQDAAAALDDAGTADAIAQSSNVLEASCDKEWVWSSKPPVDSTTGIRSPFHVFPAVDVAKVISAWACEPVAADTSACPVGYACSGDKPPQDRCVAVLPRITADGVVVPCGTTTVITKNGVESVRDVSDERRFKRAKLMLSP